MRGIVEIELKSERLVAADSLKFNNALALSEGYSTKSCGIGVRAEKLLHRVLKLYIDSNTENHEIEYLGSVVDIKNDSGIYEIQTRSLDKLLPKLRKLLKEEKVCVVIPLAYEKRIAWIDNNNGEISEGRLSPKRENIYDAFKMLFGLREIIPNENLTIKLVYLKTLDLRNLDGYGKDKKRRSTRNNRIPCEILWELDLKTRDDYISFLPENLPAEFTLSELSSLVKRTTRYTFYILQLLLSASAVIPIGTKGRARAYKVNRD